MQKAGAHLHFEFATDFVLYLYYDCTHPPACSDGTTPLNLAIDKNELNVVSLLRRAGASL